MFNCFAINTENVILIIYLPYNNAYRKKKERMNAAHDRSLELEKATSHKFL